MGITEKAYELWAAHKIPFSDMPVAARKEITIHYLTNKLFQSLTANKWYEGIANFFSRICKMHLLRHVKKALSAYKFDLITSSKKLTADHLWLFDKKELPYTDNLRAIFTKNLLRKNGLSIEWRGKRWENKVAKYYHNPRFLFANTGLSLVADQFPQIKTWVGIIKPLKAKTIENTADYILGKDDLAFQQGFFNLIGRKDFTLNRSLQSLAVAAFFEVAKEKAKYAYQHPWETCNYVYHSVKDAAMKYWRGT